MNDENWEPFFDGKATHTACPSTSSAAMGRELVRGRGRGRGMRKAPLVNRHLDGQQIKHIAMFHPRPLIDLAVILFAGIATAKCLAIRETVR